MVWYLTLQLFMGNPLFFFRKGEKTVLKSFVEIVLGLAIARGGENRSWFCYAM
jgi:hypothetical protein